jgi:PST family polysaccharide transporter
MLLDRCTQVLVGVGIVAVLARALGPDGFAAFQYAQSLAYIGASVALVCGSEVVIPRLVALARAADQHRLLVHVFRLRLFAAGCGYLLVCGLLLLTRQPVGSWQPALVLGVAILLREPSGVVIAWLQAHTQSRPGTLVNLASLALKACAVAGLAATGERMAGTYAMAFVLEPLLAAALLAVFYRSRMPRARIHYDARLTGQLFRDGSLFWISFMLMMAARRIDQLILRPYVPSAEFAAYAATVQVVDNYTALATILASGIAPLYVYTQRDRLAGVRNVMKLTLLMIAAGVTGAAAIILLAPWIVHVLYGSAFSHAGSLLRLAALVSPLVFADVGFSVLAAYLRKPRWIAIKWGVAFPATIAVDYLCIPRFGAQGAIIGYAVASTLTVAAGVCMWLYSRKSMT